MSAPTRDPAARPVCLFAHPSAELFGADRMLLESVVAAREGGFDCLVVLPEGGPLVASLVEAGARVVISRGLVVRKALLRPRNWSTLVRGTLRGLGGAVRLLRQAKPDCVYVNTITIPLWPIVARLRGVPCISHVHEAEASGVAIVNRALYAPHLASDRVLVNSRFSLATIARDLPPLARRSHVLYNGVVGPSRPSPPRAEPEQPLRVLYVGRLSPRKGPDVLVEAARILHDAGTPVHVSLLGSVFAGYEWFEEQLRSTVDDHGLADHVSFLGFRPEIWPVVAEADVLVVPSTVDEPFGNTAVEGILALRPVIASDTSGLREAAGGYPTTRLVPPGDARALAAALHELRGNWASMLSELRGSADRAQTRHSPEAYRERVLKHLRATRVLGAQRSAPVREEAAGRRA